MRKYLIALAFWVVIFLPCSLFAQNGCPVNDYLKNGLDNIPKDSLSYSIVINNDKLNVAEFNSLISLSFLQLSEISVLDEVLSFSDSLAIQEYQIMENNYGIETVVIYTSFINIEKATFQLMEIFINSDTLQDRFYLVNGRFKEIEWNGNFIQFQYQNSSIRLKEAEKEFALLKPEN